MTVTSNPNENDLVPVSRIVLKQSGLVVRIIRSASGHEYKVVWMDNRVVGCEQVSGEPCKGWAYRRSCHHATLVQQLEAEREAQEPYASRLHNGVSLDRYNAAVESQNSEESIERRIQEREAPSQKGTLSSASGKAFSLLR